MRKTSLVLDVSRAVHAPRDSFQFLFDNMQEGMAYCRLLLDADGEPVDAVFLVVNPAVGQLVGENDTLGRRVRELLPDIVEDSPALFAVYRRVAKSGKPEAVDRFLPRKNRWLRISAFRPSPHNIAILVNDITDRKVAEGALRESELRHRMIFEHAATGIAITDWQGRFHSCIPAYCNLLG